jgi:alkylated DNA repair protein alkB family protein 8
VCAKLLRRVSERFGGDVPGADRAALCDQLTVNEYPAGVGLAPHVDTHSAFGPAILSVSLAGGAAFEFRLLKTTTEAEEDGGVVEEEEGEEEWEWGEDPSPVFRAAPPAVARRAAIYLPPRSLLVLSGEARYRWQHYVPHRRRDRVAGEAAPRPREPRRVSFTFRERREGRCACAWPAACDSRRGAAQALRRRDRPGMCGAPAERGGAGAEGRGG